MLPDPVAQFREWWGHQSHDASTEDPRVAAGLLRRLEADGLLRLPDPGHGQTHERFAQLATIGELDLTLGRLAEAHADAGAILRELGGEPVRPGQLWGVWAAEPPERESRGRAGRR